MMKTELTESETLKALHELMGLEQSKNCSNCRFIVRKDEYELCWYLKGVVFQTNKSESVCKHWDLDTTKKGR